MYSYMYIISSPLWYGGTLLPIKIVPGTLLFASSEEPNGGILESYYYFYFSTDKRFKKLR